MEYGVSLRYRKLKPNGQQLERVFDIAGGYFVETLDEKHRAVKKAFQEAEGKCTCPSDLPYCVCGSKTLGRIVNKKPIIETKEKQEVNPRSKSAKLRIFERREKKL